MTSKIELINDYFKLPIYYNVAKMELNKNIITDLELIHTQTEAVKDDKEKEKEDKEKEKEDKEKEKDDKEKAEVQGNKSIYKYAFQPKNAFGEKILEQMPIYYTTDVDFLNDTQSLLKNYKALVPDDKQNVDDILELWNEIKNDTGFKERYQYIDWTMWEFLNKSEIFLQVMSIYNLISPVLSLFLPIILLIVPFFVIKMKGLNLNMTEYIQILKVIASNHAIGKIFTDFSSVNTNEKIYIIMSAFFYLFSIYQNILICLRFHENMKKIHRVLFQMQKYIEHTESSIDNVLRYTTNLTTYQTFNATLSKNKKQLIQLREQIERISPYTLSFTKSRELGNVLKCFYEIYSNEDYNESILYSFGVHGYIDILEGFIGNMHGKHIHCACLSKSEAKNKNSNKNSNKKSNKKSNKNKKISFKQFYYPALMNNHPVKNKYSFQKNMIITGPNASGKTTILKSVLINVILTQQFGCGFYKSAKLVPFKFIHCYLNIPDTSGRDSLFQSESRRCKEILNVIKENNIERHFCVFDELYSGTNPEEAVLSATAFMKYLAKYRNVNCILTTHFIQICSHLENHLYISNYKMGIEHSAIKNDIHYTYHLMKGISTVRGGIKILCDMNYPQEIIDSITRIEETEQNNTAY